MKLASPFVMCVQYHGGYHDKCGGYLEYHGGVQYRGDIMSTVGDITGTMGDGYLEYHGNILSTMGILSTIGIS